MSVKRSARRCRGSPSPPAPQSCAAGDTGCGKRTLNTPTSWASDTAQLKMDTTATALCRAGDRDIPVPSREKRLKSLPGSPPSGVWAASPHLPCRAAPTALAAQWLHHHPRWGTGWSSRPEGLRLEAETVTDLCLHTRTSLWPSLSKSVRAVTTSLNGFFFFSFFFPSVRKEIVLAGEIYSTIFPPRSFR